MANEIKHKRSSTALSRPSTSNLVAGEIAINTYDGKLYIEMDSGTPEVIQIGVMQRRDTNYIAGQGAGLAIDIAQAQNNILIGQDAGAAVQFGDSNIAIGKDTLAGDFGQSNVIIGHEACTVADDPNGTVVIGYRCMQTQTVAPAVAIGSNIGGTKINFNGSVVIGKNIAIGNTSTNNYTASVIIGDSASLNGNFCTSSVVIGNNAARGISDAIPNACDDNVIIGAAAGQNMSTGVRTVIVGCESGYGSVSTGTSGSDNTFLGFRAGKYGVSCANNTFLGRSAGEGINGSEMTGNNNVGVGYDALNNIITTAANNTTVGKGSGFNISTGIGNVIVGYLAGPTTNQSNQLFIDNITTDTPLIHGDFSTNIATINGVMSVTGNIKSAVGTITSAVADGAAAKAFTLTSDATYSTDGAKLLSIMNNATEIAYAGLDNGVAGIWANRLAVGTAALPEYGLASIAGGITIDASAPADTAAMSIDPIMTFSASIRYASAFRGKATVRGSAVLPFPTGMMFEVDNDSSMNWGANPFIWAQCPAVITSRFTSTATSTGNLGSWATNLNLGAPVFQGSKLSSSGTYNQIQINAVNAGSVWDNSYGVYIRPMTGNLTEGAGILIDAQQSAAVVCLGDGVAGRILLGAGRDAFIDYDGTNLVIDPALVGSGIMDVQTAATFTGGVDSLTSATTVVNVSASAAPVAGRVLTATSSTAATWQVPATPAAAALATTGASVNVSSSAPPATDRMLVATSATTATWQALDISKDASPTLGGDLACNGKELTNLMAPAAQQTQTANYTAVLTDADKMITMNNASARTVTIPANASVAYTIGTKLNFMQIGAGALTIAITTDTLNVNADLTKVLNGQYSVATAMKITATSWVIFGNLVPA